MPVVPSTRQLPALLVAVVLVLLAPLLTTDPATAAAPPRPAAPSTAVHGHLHAEDCPPAGSQELRTRPGAQVSEPPGAAPARDLLAGVAGPLSRSAVGVSPPGSVVVPTYVHVIASGRTRAQGYLTRAEVDRQLTVLDRAFAGTSGPGAVATPFRFRRMAVTWTVAPQWYDLQPGGPVERQAKAALRRGDDTALNIYVAGLSGGLFGYSDHPEPDDTVRPWRDGVVVSNRNVPGGGEPFYDQGDTLPHEVGHWLGLYHTFDGGCSDVGDRVADTPRQSQPTAGCPPGKDSCRAFPGLDPVHNFMDYSYDACMFTFTRGQVARMDAVWKGFRAGTH